jgi:hypothetical protein
MNSMRLSGLEVELMQLLIAGNIDGAKAWMIDKDWVDANGKKSREAREVAAKLESLGLAGLE